jgi:ferrous iron transport protein A
MEKENRMTEKTIPLTMVTPGRSAKVSAVRAGWGLQRRLADMGLIPGRTVKVINNQRRFPIIIDLMGTRLGLGHGVAQKILVEVEK